jgi:Uma2 family endonuclease
MTGAARKLATYEDLLAQREDLRAEIRHGMIETLPSPLPSHGRVQRSLSNFIGKPFDDDDGVGGPGGWWLFTEVDVRFEPHEVARPDLSGWRRERLPRPNVRPIDVVPDWVCEIQSPSTAAHDRVYKRNLYAKFGVAHYWLIDPDARTLEALTLGPDRTWLATGAWDESSLARIAPFEAIELPVGRLFLPRSATDEP